MPERLERLWIEYGDWASEKPHKAMLVESWLCAEGETPRKVGTPAVFAAPSSDWPPLSEHRHPTAKPFDSRSPRR